VPFTRLTRLIATRADAFSRSENFARFYREREPNEARLLGRLFSIVECIEAGDDDLAAASSEALFRTLSGGHDEDSLESRTSVVSAGAIRVIAVFADALYARVKKHTAGGGNLYLGARPQGTQLRAFELLRRHTPLIAFGYAVANEAILDAVGAYDGADPKDLIVVDIGIGRASQHRALLESVRGRNLLKSFHVVGVDGDSSLLERGLSSSFSPREGALEIARAVVLDEADAAGVPSSFEAVPMLAEELTASELRAAAYRSRHSRRVGDTCAARVVATSAFALHHLVDIGDQTLSARDAVLRTLRAAGARHVVLVEPDSDHFGNDLSLRFLHAYRHYRTVSQVLARSLSPDDADIVWNEFFAPEVRNVIAHDGVRRVERHEELSRWAERVEAAGFHVDDLAAIGRRIATPAGFEVQIDRTGLRLCFEGVSLVGVLRASA
jgi:GRAS domain family